MKKPPCIHENLTVRVESVEENNAYVKGGKLRIRDDGDLLSTKVASIRCRDCNRYLPRLKSLDHDWE